MYMVPLPRAKKPENKDVKLGSVTFNSAKEIGNPSESPETTLKKLHEIVDLNLIKPQEDEENG